MISSIITNKNVDTTYDGVECLLKRTITNKFHKSGRRTYFVLTERVVWDEMLLPDLDDNGDIQYEEDGVTLKESMQPYLKVLEQKDKVSEFSVTDAEADALFNAIRELVNLGESFSEFERDVETMSLMYVTQQDRVWGTSPEDWKILNE